VLPALPYGTTQLRTHLAVLIDRDFVVAHRSQATEPLQYRLLCDQTPATRSHLCLGLIDPEAIETCASDDSSTGSTVPSAGCYRVVAGSLSGRYRVGENGENAVKHRANGHTAGNGAGEHARHTQNGAVVAADRSRQTAPPPPRNGVDPDAGR